MRGRARRHARLALCRQPVGISWFLTNRGDKCRENWYRGKLDAVASEVGYLAEYELMQRNLSNSVHSTPLGLLQGAGVTPDILVDYAMALNLRIIGAMADYIGVALDEFEQTAIALSRRSLCDYPPPKHRAVSSGEGELERIIVTRVDRA